MTEEVKLPTVEEHNAALAHKYQKYEPQPAGVSCPNCGKEMFFRDENILASYPPRRLVICKEGHAQASIIV